MHGDRCEGTYIQPVAGTALWLASLTESFAPYDLTSRADLVVEWTASRRPSDPAAPRGGTRRGCDRAVEAWGMAADVAAR
jgi:hypothetical protein